MEFNTDTRVSPSQLFDIQLKYVADKINSSIQSGNSVTVEDSIIEASSLLSNFANGIGGISDKFKYTMHGSLPNHMDFNANIDSIIGNLEVLFESVDDLEQSIVSSFNYIVAESERILKEVRKINSTLLDYGIYTDSASAGLVFYTDSFNDSSKIDPDITLLNETMASVNDAVGSVTLAEINDESSIKQVKKITINEASNGAVGNNNEIGALFNGDLGAILDSNPDTWFEYEFVTSEDSPLSVPLILDVVLELQDIEPINSIVIDPNNFGTKHPVIIDTIETSIDGVAWSAIEQRSSALSFLKEKDSDKFVLAPQTSKYKGKGVFPFFPRNVRYIHLVLKQNNYFPINTTSGTKIRYAIGIKDIEVHSHKYESKSEIVTKRIYAPSEIKKISIQSSEIKESDVALANVSHFISPDDGITWHEVQPRNVQKSKGIPEILNFNTIDEGSVLTKSKVDFIRYKIALERNDENFSTTSSLLSKSKVDISETFNVSDKAPLFMDLAHSPITSTIVVLDPIFGSVGNSARRKTIGVSSGEQSQQVNMPWKNIDTDTEEIWVGGSLWTRVASFTGAGQYDKVYRLDYVNGIIYFGDGTNGKIPEKESRIEMNFLSERLNLSSRRIAKLNFWSDGDKENIIVKRIYSDSNEYGDVLKKGATIHRLKHADIIADSELIYESGSSFTTKVAYVDGISELTVPGEYSINFKDGIMYSYSPTELATESSISYTYTPKKQLSSDDWDFYSSADGANNMKNEIQIKEPAYITEQIVDEPVTQSVRAFSFSKTNIEPGSVKIKELKDGGNPLGRLTKEVAFVDGVSELSNREQIKEESIPSGGTSFQFNMASTEGIALVQDPRPVFSDKSVFDPNKELNFPNLPTATGEYMIDYTTGDVTTFDAIQNNSTVSYYYSDNSVNIGGNYSIDYENGILYSYDSIYTGTTASYSFSNYEIIYSIARLIESDKYYYDTSLNSIVINDNEVISGIISTRDTSVNRIFKVSYSYIDEEIGSISELKEFYTPFVDGYAISIVDIDNFV